MKRKDLRDYYELQLYTVPTEMENDFGYITVEQW